jgi:probable rRNA maturation factor
VLLGLGIRSAGLGVVFVSARRMREINRRFLDRDYATDVLSFGYGREVVEGVRFLGEVVIAPEVAWRRARLRRDRTEREIRMLLVHGILHLLGYDHETDTGRMARLQRKLLRRQSRAGKILAARFTVEP